MKRATIRAAVLALPSGEGAQQPSGKKRGGGAFMAASSLCAVGSALFVSFAERHTYRFLLQARYRLLLFWAASHGVISADRVTRRLGSLAGAR
jgi:hypothetical protein